MTRRAIHPGEHLADAIKALGITAARLARDIRVPANRVTGILHGTRAITADTAIRLGRYFGTSAVFWMNLQQLYELRSAEKHIGKNIKSIPRGNSGLAKPAHFSA
jgi:antitoxin HigA-1